MFVRCRGLARWRRSRRSWSGSGWTCRGRSSGCRIRRSSGPGGRGRTCCWWWRCRASRARWRSSRRCCAHPRGVFAAALFVVTLILRVALNVARGGTHRLDSSLFVGVRGEGKNEYLPSLAAFDYGPRFFLDRFAELVPSLPVHSAGHPPGLLVTMHYLGLDTSPKLAAFIIVVGAVSAPLTYVLAKRAVRGGRGARRRACWPRSRPRCCTSAPRAPTPSTSRSACSPRSRC